MHPGSPELNDGSEGSLCVIMDVKIVLYLNTSYTERWCLTHSTNVELMYNSHWLLSIKYNFLSAQKFCHIYCTIVMLIHVYVLFKMKLSEYSGHWSKTTHFTAGGHSNNQSVMLVITYIGVIKAIMSSPICWANLTAACYKKLVRGQICREKGCRQKNYH